MATSRLLGLKPALTVEFGEPADLLSENRCSDSGGRASDAR
jgi:hypothetical protein